MTLDLPSIRTAEHFAFHSDLSLDQLCDRIRREFGLAALSRDRENETEWGAIVHDGLEYNVSRPYREGTLQRWDDSVPAGCNVGFTLSISVARSDSTNAPGNSEQLVERVGAALANALGVAVHHHRTWLGPGKHVRRQRVFEPLG